MHIVDGVYRLDPDERAALARSAEDVRQGRFASDEEVQEVFARFRHAARRRPGSP